MFLLSLPMRERGLKCGNQSQKLKTAVAPHAGAWIEILMTTRILPHSVSLPMRGAWIEILPHRWPGIGNKKALKGAFLFFIYSFLIFRQCSYCLTGRGGRSLRGLWRRGW